MKAYLHKPPTYLGCGEETSTIDEVIEGESVEQLIVNACAQMPVDRYAVHSGDGNDAELYLIADDLSEQLRAAWQEHKARKIAEEEEATKRRETDKATKEKARKVTELEREIARIEDGSALAKKRADLEALRAPAPPTADEAAP